MRIKTKLYIGFSFLFFVIVIIWAGSSIYIFQLSNDSEAILKDNYKSIILSNNMASILDDMKNYQLGFLVGGVSKREDSIYLKKSIEFANNLDNEKHNITENGEREMVTQLEQSFNDFLQAFESERTNPIIKDQPVYYNILQHYQQVKSVINSISDINMGAIIRKNDHMKAKANSAFVYISIFGTICFLISFTMLMNFPRNISSPIRELTQGIQEIARKNYDQQLYFSSNDEFGELASAFNIMTKKLNEYEKSNLSEILFEKKRIEAIISNIKDAVIGLDQNRNLIFTNPASEILLGVKTGELIGKGALDIASKNDLFHNIIKELSNETYHSKEFKPLKIIVGGKESFYIKEIVDVYYTNTGEDKQQLIGYLIILKNITKFQELDDAKTSFIATISHELKNPISSARLNLKLLEDTRVGELNKEQKALLDIVKEELARVIKITGELLDLTQVESGNINLQIRPVAPHEIIRYAMNSIKYQAELKRIKIKVNAQEPLPLIAADVEKTAWVLINFINNAIHYSPQENTIIIDAIQDGNSVKFSVRDFGRGIEEQYLEKIFEKFFRVPGYSRDGTGLGLAISKEFIDKQKGKIWAESKTGEGSIFYFTLPVIAA